MSCELTPIPVNDDILDAVASGSYYSPHSVLGAHLSDTGVTTPRHRAPRRRGPTWLPRPEPTRRPTSAAAFGLRLCPAGDSPLPPCPVTYGEDTTLRDDPTATCPPWARWTPPHL